jgi:hypothetical protein
MAAKKTFHPTGKPKRPVPPRPAVPRQPQPAFFQQGFWRHHRIPALALMVLSFLLYGITVTYGYLQDDQLVIWDNTFVQKGFAGLREIFSFDSLLGYYKDPKLLLEGGRYRPLPLATYAIEIGLFGKNNPGISHFFNVLLYGGTAVLLYRIVLALIPQAAAPAGATWYLGVPFLASAIFLMHPLHTEAVANIKGRDEILALLGGLGALYAMMKYFDTDQHRWLFAAAGCLFLGLLSKENAMTFLAVIPLTLWVFSRIPAGRLLASGLVLAAAAFVFILVRYKALGYMVNNGKSAAELTLDPFLGMSAGERFATIFLTLGWYLKLLLFPHPLTIDYYPYHVPKVGWSDWRPIVSLALYLGAGVWAARQVARARKQDAAPTATAEGWVIPAYCILFYLLTVSVVSNIFVSTSTFMNERYLYMPSVGFSLLAAWLLAWKLPAWQQKPGYKPALAGVVLIGLLAVLYSLRVWTRLPDWGGNGQGLVASALKASPGSYRANYYYAAMLYQERYRKLENDPGAAAARKRLADALNFYIDKSLKINPGYRLAGTMKATVAAARYREDRQLDKLLRELEALTKSQPYNGDMLINLLDILKSLKGSDPNLYNFFCHRVGFDFYFKEKRDFNGAAAFLNLALDNYPLDATILQDLIDVYTAMGDPGKATELRLRLQAVNAGR